MSKPYTHYVRMYYISRSGREGHLGGYFCSSRLAANLKLMQLRIKYWRDDRLFEIEDAATRKSLGKGAA